MAYSNKVLDHYNNPRNVGSFDQQDRGCRNSARRISRRRSSGSED